MQNEKEYKLIEKCTYILERVHIHKTQAFTLKTLHVPTLFDIHQYK